MRIPRVLSGVVLASVIAAAVSAHGDATGVVRDRMAAMEEMDRDVRSLDAMLLGGAAYDAGQVRALAERIGAHAGRSMTRLFPKGSHGAPSEARPEIWSNWPEFRDLAERLHTYAEGLALAADNGAARRGTSHRPMMGGGTGMMAGGMMTGGAPGLEELSEMPADGVFMMLTATCSACHARFRAGQ